MNIFLLARVSSQRQEKEETIEVQIEYLKRWADLNEHVILGIYADEAVSGTVPLADRPEGQRLLEDLSRLKPDAVAVYRIDRLGRSIMVVYAALDALEKASCAFISATEAFDTSTSFGRIMVGFIALFAQFEREAIAQRCLDGKLEAARNGTWPGGREKFGYLLREKRLVVNPETAALVRLIFSLFVNAHQGLHRITASLEADGFQPPSQLRGENRGHSGRWHHATILNILRDPAYKGTASWGGIEFPVPPIVSEIEWDKAQSLLRDERRQGWSQTATHTYLLGGLLRCGVCNKPFQGTVWKNGRRLTEGHAYTCARKINYNYGKGPRCSLSPWLDGTIDHVILADCAEMLDRPELLGEMLREQRATEEANWTQMRRDKHTLQARRENLREGRARILALYRDAEITEDDWRDQQAIIAEEDCRIALRINALEGSLLDLSAVQRQIDEVEMLLGHLREQPLTDADKVRLLVREIVVSPGADGRPQVTVTYWPNAAKVSPGTLPSVTKDQSVTVTSTRRSSRLSQPRFCESRESLAWTITRRVASDASPTTGCPVADSNATRSTS